ncbi:hypothetical protein L1S34_14020 [Flavobacterium sp. K77]|uniref:hypothetical protein n=1 Tax=Flavobacterium sp. K77 TaxID=2910676 RepID=UPI001F2DCF9D|nr:hypothetical protein [Flavobacterium sp. K77]MCF6142409.1 hypothetical protein [Flavobacterium sp. K77]
MKKDVQEEIKKENCFSEEAKTDNTKNISQDQVMIDPIELPISIQKKDEKHFQRVDKQGDLFSDYFSDFKK